MGRIGGGELLIIALIALLLFVSVMLSDIGKGLGEGIKNFKKGLREDPDDAASKTTVEAKAEDASKKA